jgi:putative membrane protein
LGPTRLKEDDVMLLAILSVLLTALAITAVAWLLPGVRVRSFGTAVVVSLVYAILHALFFKLLVLLTLPITLLTLGLFLFVINAFLLWLTSQLVDGFEVRGFGVTVLAAALISLFSALLHSILL